MIRRHCEMEIETRERMRGGSGKVVIRHIFGKNEFSAKTRLCARLLLEPGSGIGPHTHENEDELFIVLSGSGIVDDGGQKTRVSAGDAILTKNGETHAVYNDSSEPLEILAMILLYA